MNETNVPSPKLPKKILLLAILSSVFVTALLCVSVVVARDNRTHSIAGTFMSGGITSLPSEYFAFTKTEGIFYYYRQNELLDEGNYVCRDDGVCSLYSKDGTGVTMEVIFANDKIYRIGRDGLSTVYDRIASETMLINIAGQTTLGPSRTQGNG